MISLVFPLKTFWPIFHLIIYSVSSGLWQFLSLLFYDLVLRSQVFCRMSLSLEVFGNSLMIPLRLCRGKYHRSEFLLITCYTWLITDGANVDHMIKVVFARFLHCKVISQHFPYSVIWEQIIKSKPHTRKAENWAVPPWKGSISYITWNPCVLYIFHSYLFFHSFISLWTHMYLLYALGYNYI